ncbi:MAG: mucoidy inhibitor MuiA family protein [Planctomycetota bacterium]
MFRRIVALVVWSAAALAGQAYPAGIEAPGAINAVTLYRGQALVTRKIPVKADPGYVQLVVTGLPERIRSDSLYAAADAGTQVRAVRFRRRVVEEAPRADVRELDKQLEALEAELRQVESEQRMIRQKTAYLDRLEQFAAPTAKVELAKGVLNAETLKSVTLFVFEQRVELAKAGLAASEKHRELKENLTALQQKRALLTRVRSRSVREAIVFLEKGKPGATTVRLSYLVDGATWSPAYNVRAKPGRARVELEYNAVITQMSGEDWKSVELTLSTASPRMTADAPILAPLPVTLQQRHAETHQLARIRQRFSQASAQLRKHEQRRQKAFDRGSQIEAQWWLNQAAHGIQVWELYVPEPLARVAQDMARQEFSGLSVNYALPGRAHVDSREDQQIARIAELTLPAEFTHVAVPLLTEHVYRQATITNNGDVALLEGQRSVYLNGDFVGKGTVPMVASGQRFLAGFGIAPQLRSWRELISKDENIQGANREVTYEYRLVLDNYGDDPTPVRLYDRLPYTQEAIRVTRIDGFDNLSRDAEYNRVFKPQGILRWDILVGRHAAGGTAKLVEYGFRLEYDKNMDITAATGDERQAKIKQIFEKQLLAQ